MRKRAANYNSMVGALDTDYCAGTVPTPVSPKPLSICSAAAAFSCSFAVTNVSAASRSAESAASGAAISGVAQAAAVVVVLSGSNRRFGLGLGHEFCRQTRP